jgi:propionyl-CoA carboxylase beta chain
VVKASTGEEVDFDTLGGAKTHASKSGGCHFVSNSEQECYRTVKELLSYLPDNCYMKPSTIVSNDSPKRELPLLERLCSMDPKKPYRVHHIIWWISDDHKFLEVHRNFAKNIVVGFARLNGEVVGIVANNSSYMAGALDIDASDKAARFIRFLNNFNIPILTLVDVPGYWPGVKQEHNGIIRHGAKLLYAYCESTVPKVTIITRKAYGGAYDVLSSKHIRGDINYAYPTAEIAVMGPDGAVNILFRKEIEDAQNVEEKKKSLVDEYRRTFANPYRAAELGYIDEIIKPESTRPKVIQAFTLLANKRQSNPPKKHDNLPL